MNLYEYEGKEIFKRHGINVPKGVLIRKDDDCRAVYESFAIQDVVLKAQTLSGKRGKNQGIVFCSSADEVEKAIKQMFANKIRGQLVTAVLLEERLDIAKEHYLSIAYDTKTRRPVMVYSQEGGMDVEDVEESKITKHILNISHDKLGVDLPCSDELWLAFRKADARLMEINPLVLTADNTWVAADAKVALDPDAFYRHEEWQEYEPRTVMGRPATSRELEIGRIDEGEKYYQGTAGKYIEMEGDIAVLMSGGGASIANMDALFKNGLMPANYTEYSGNPPREKVYELARIVLSKPGLRGLWIVGGVANFTDVAETFGGIVDALDEVKPNYPVVVRRAGPNEDDGMKIMKECAERNNLNIKLFGKEISMSESAKKLAEMVKS